jgi:hypothetical protein
MRVVAALPPNFDMLVEAFPFIRGNDKVIFTYGDTIYAPGGEARLTPELRAHEGVHYSRQGSDIDGWWRRYITDPEFRLAEELPAHRAEFRTFCKLNRDPNARIRFLYALGERLAGPLYGGILRATDARRRIADR